MGDISKSINALIDVTSYPVWDNLDVLLKDRSTGKNIIWATDAYESLADDCTNVSKIRKDVFVSDRPIILNPRIEKTCNEKVLRTRHKGEVFTPLWLCNHMNNACDEKWFGRHNVFNNENKDHTWAPEQNSIPFPDNILWTKYVDSRRLEITCGEGPFLVTRYDVTTGEIIPVEKRIGILDRKLRVVDENTQTKDEWEKWAIRAYQSCYGYEWQGDSLLIARINLLVTFQDYYLRRWKTNPEQKLLHTIATTISWNIWQMDGMTDTSPFGEPFQPIFQTTLYDSFQSGAASKNRAAPSSKIYDWRSNTSTPFYKCKERTNMDKKKLFDFVIGNPPYHETKEGTSDMPVYNVFMDASYRVADRVMLITPARFLSNAGKTPKQWNKKMLEDPHLSVLEYFEDASTVFPGTDIKGGVVITYRDAKQNIGPIGIFTAFPELNSIIAKIGKDFLPLSSVVYTESKFTQKMLDDHPEIPYRDENHGILSKGDDFRIVTNIFDKLENIVFYDSIPDDENEYIIFIGRKGNKRTRMYIRSDYVTGPENLYKYKVVLPKSNGSGTFGELLSEPFVVNPGIGYTQTFISIGCFDEENEAINALKYVKTKFARAMLGVKKVTQDNHKSTWQLVPLQDFSKESDIDWAVGIPKIDEQLFDKYNLSNDEIDFINAHVKEME